MMIQEHTEKKNWAAAGLHITPILVLFFGLFCGQVFWPADDARASSPVATTKNLSSEQRLEIDHLLHYIENSACLFRRNDGWYGAREAANHIRSKYRWLVERGRIASSEEFIDKAASQSSITGRLYLVRCATQETSSSQWLAEELQRYRKEHPGKTSK